MVNGLRGYLLEVKWYAASSGCRDRWTGLPLIPIAPGMTGPQVVILVAGSGYWRSFVGIIAEASFHVLTDPPMKPFSLLSTLYIRSCLLLPDCHFARTRMGRLSSTQLRVNKYSHLY